MGRQLKPMAWRAALCALLLCLGACGRELPALAPDQVRAQQTVDGLTVTLDTARDPRVNEAQRFSITLTDRAGRPVDGADIYLDLEMAMICLGAKPVAEPQGAGQYWARSVYPMAGDWEVTVVVEDQVGERRATFAIPVAEP
jgi:hypothetical protein